ncbi:hypothetical protein SAMN05192573_12435 [Mucilaginibacter gossypii]|uniref:Uncharacterized protein n=1 Tax=Mucilaginibacter gossypii TaxID=551996 RepID=A0A1G8LSQ9_9SPHI|nr:hypothetical protein SAMN05192573_12435 [Mucilaginibacter gossypii]
MNEAIDGHYLFIITKVNWLSDQYKMETTDGSTLL